MGHEVRFDVVQGHRIRRGPRMRSLTSGIERFIRQSETADHITYYFLFVVNRFADVNRDYSCKLISF